ncbi:MAG: hypothetical protein QN178_16915 [Armatimonadota bacterium]|nr:hypothetical protein [Armatimonadota bacterium]
MRQIFLWTEVTTAYRPRTEVERWQIQERLALKLRHLGCEAPPRFYEGPGGRLAFRIRSGFRLAPALARALARIDDVTPPAG